MVYDYHGEVREGILLSVNKEPTSSFPSTESLS